jgi:hypothetical protein
MKIHQISRTFQKLLVDLFNTTPKRPLYTPQYHSNNITHGVILWSVEWTFWSDIVGVVLWSGRFGVVYGVILVECGIIPLQNVHSTLHNTTPYTTPKRPFHNTTPTISLQNVHSTLHNITPFTTPKRSLHNTTPTVYGVVLWSVEWTFWSGIVE